MAVKLSHGKALSMLSLTSLIDVVFLLLIFFLVATKFAEEDALKQLPTQLPSASEARPLTQKPDELKITVSAAGGYFVGTQAMNLAELDRYLERSAANNPLSQQASIYGDKRASWEAMVQALNACQKHGIKPTPMMENRAVME
jgi:biopolymer transport protein ExbD